MQKLVSRLALGAAAVIVMAGAAQAEDLFAAAYGNTVTQTMPDGSKTVIYVNADHTWEQHRGDKVLKGTFAWKDDHTACFTITDPTPKDPAKATNCNDIKGPAHKVGDTWTEKLPKDQGSITMAITAGR